MKIYKITVCLKSFFLILTKKNKYFGRGGRDWILSLSQDFSFLKNLRQDYYRSHLKLGNVIVSTVLQCIITINYVWWKQKYNYELMSDKVILKCVYKIITQATGT